MAQWEDPVTGRVKSKSTKTPIRWAQRMNLIAKVPQIDFPKAVGGMKGRPITEEEFDRFLVQLDKSEELQPIHRENWKQFARGLWLSGLRLEEAMRLHWTEDRMLCPDFSHRRPMLRIQAAAEKVRKYRLLPMTPDFAEFLLAVPAGDRRGFVFNPYTAPRGKMEGTHRPTASHAGKVLSTIGEEAGIRVSEKKFASAHDFRRAFGYRWSKRVMPKVLQELMRHASIQTTMQFYVGNLAEDAADEVWKAAALASGNTFGNSRHSEESDHEANKSETA